MHAEFDVGDAVPQLVEAAEPLEVDVQQFPGSLPLIPLHWLSGPQIAQARQAGATRYPADRGFRDAHVRGDGGLQKQLAPQLYDRRGDALIDRPGRALLPLGLVQQLLGPAGQVAATPLACSDTADAMLGSGFLGGQATLDDALDHFQAAQIRQSGILMGVHPVAGFAVDCGIWRLGVSQNLTG